MSNGCLYCQGQALYNGAHKICTLGLSAKACVLGMQAGDEHIVQSVARMQQVIELSRTIRERHAKPLKQPLRSLTVVAADASFLADIQGELRHYVIEEVHCFSSSSAISIR